MLRKIVACLVLSTLVCLTIYLNSVTIPQRIGEFVAYSAQRVFGDQFTCVALRERPYFTELGFTDSPDLGKYVVRMYEHLNWTTSATVTPSPPTINCPACTNLLLKESVRSTHQFPFNGTWLRYVVNQSKEFYHFHPHLCSFSEKDLTESYVLRCLTKKNIRKVVTIGDSNSRRLVDGIVSVLSNSSASCKLVDEESSLLQPNPKYYLRNVTFDLSDVSFRGQSCGTCASRRFVCSYNATGEEPERKTESWNLEVEQISNTRIIDNSRQIKVKLGEKFLPTNISQEFLLRDYLRFDGYPDVVLFQMPLLHEIFYGLIKTPGNKEKLRKPLKQLIGLFEKYVPYTTSMYLLPNQFIFESSPNSQAYIRNRILRESIDVFFEETESVLGSTSNYIFPFFDLFELAQPVKSLHLVEDPVHMKPAWYDIIAKYILELHCNS